MFYKGDKNCDLRLLSGTESPFLKEVYPKRKANGPNKEQILSF